MNIALPAAAAAFAAAALAIPATSAGALPPRDIGDPVQYGDWIQDVERPAAQFRGRYQLKLEEAHDVLGAPGT